MHDEVLALMDDCLTRLMLMRADLAASRRVEPGERRATVLQAIAAAEQFADAAGRAIEESKPKPVVLRGAA
jgi:uncharacterized protein with PhoU and TrkA domain